ncbi:transmembrane protein, putative [Bodo saltans]|uniref:Transmembrane protein, putative n=1 Tax=Bodo saltans TaxID=75058 RepID=A0A0S4JB94_BODSA|nr:transmembrane protein, putative [Bodo saltans]|eukprot:CUG86422.1 transmembrane protein, putative [Bodo saltans]
MLAVPVGTQFAVSKAPFTLAFALHFLAIFFFFGMQVDFLFDNFAPPSYSHCHHSISFLWFDVWAHAFGTGLPHSLSERCGIAEIDNF